MPEVNTMFEIQVIFTKDRKTENFEVSRVPCIGEYLIVSLGDDNERSHTVTGVSHILNSDPDDEIVAYVYVD